jgi:hypothetical protein
MLLCCALVHLLLVQELAMRQQEVDMLRAQLDDMYNSHDASAAKLEAQQQHLDAQAAKITALSSTAPKHVASPLDDKLVNAAETNADNQEVASVPLEQERNGSVRRDQQEGVEVLHSNVAHLTAAYDSTAEIISVLEDGKRSQAAELQKALEAKMAAEARATELEGVVEHMRKQVRLMEGKERAATETVTALKEGMDSACVAALAQEERVRELEAQLEGGGSTVVTAKEELTPTVQDENASERSAHSTQARSDLAGQLVVAQCGAERLLHDGGAVVAALQGELCHDSTTATITAQVQLEQLQREGEAVAAEASIKVCQLEVELAEARTSASQLPLLQAELRSALAEAAKLRGDVEELGKQLEDAEGRAAQATEDAQAGVLADVAEARMQAAVKKGTGDLQQALRNVQAQMKVLWQCALNRFGSGQRQHTTCVLHLEALCCSICMLLQGIPAPTVPQHSHGSVSLSADE